MLKIGLRVQIPQQEMLLYQKELSSLVIDIEKVFFDSLLLDTKIKKQYAKLIHLDDFSDDFEKILNLLEIQVAGLIQKFRYKILKRARSIDLQNIKSVKQSLSNIKKDFIIAKRSPVIEANIRTFVSQNVRLIKTIPAKLLQEVEEIVLSAVNTGVSYEELSIQLIKRFDIQRKRADIISRDQILKLSSNLTIARFLSIGVDEYKWSTSKDERVRTSHEVLEGKICQLDNIKTYKNSIKENRWNSRTSIHGTEAHPGQEVLCRCTFIPIIKLFDD